MTPTPSTDDLWALIRAYGDCRVDADRSRGTVSERYLKWAESNLRDALAALASPAPQLASSDPEGHRQAIIDHEAEQAASTSAPKGELSEPDAWLVDEDDREGTEAALLFDRSSAIHACFEGRNPVALYRRSDPLPAATAGPSGQWQPIETAPRDRMLLLYDAAEDVRVIGFYGKHNHVPLYGWVRQVELYGDEVDGFEATHWLPLPPPPNPETPS